MNRVPDWSSLHPANPGAAWCEQLARHLRESWLSGRPLLIESYLEGVPELHGNAFGAALGALIAAEIDMWALSCPDPLAAANPLNARPPVPEGLFGARLRGVQLPPVVFADPAAEQSFNAPLPTGTQFGRYVCHLLLGQGGMGEVYFAWDALVHRFVALKVIRPDRQQQPRPVNGPDLRERFDREARAAASCDHPNLIRLQNYGFHTAPGAGTPPPEPDPYLDLAFIPGPSLEIYTRAWQPSEVRLLAPDSTASYPNTGSRSAPRARLLPVWRVAEILSRVARAVAYLHDRGMLHRDLKPSNIRFDRYGEPVVVDFGLVKLPPSAGGNKTVGAAGGTIKYMAPEAFWGGADERADVYALGLILHELLTGLVPLWGGNLIDTENMRRNRDATFDANAGAHVPHALREVCERALRRDATERIPSAAALAEALDPFTVPPTAGGAVPVRRARRWPAAMLTGIAGLGLGTGAMLARTAPDRERGGDQTTPGLLIPVLFPAAPVPEQRRPVPASAVVVCAKRYLDSLPEAMRAEVRFLTLHHRHNNQNLSRDELRRYRSTTTEFLRACAAPDKSGEPTAVPGTDDALLAIRLTDYWWNEVKWNWIVTDGQYPYDIQYHGSAFSPELVTADKALHQAVERAPVLRADWLMWFLVTGKNDALLAREGAWPEPVRTLANAYRAELLDAEAAAADLDLGGGTDVVKAVNDGRLAADVFGALLPGRNGIPRSSWESASGTDGPLFHVALRKAGVGAPNEFTGSR